MPSISFSKVVRTLTPLFRPPFSRLLPIDSISSKKMILGLAALARANMSRTARSDSPTYMLRSSAPLTAKKLKPISVAIACAERVLEQPGGPYSRRPFLGDAPRRFILSGCCFY